MGKDKGKIEVGDITGINNSIINIGSGNVDVHLPDPGVAAFYQLPDPPADFVGRAAELDELCAAVQTQGALICGLMGLGGVGKTALGLVLAHQLKAHYPDGQLYIHLRGASANPVTPAAALEQLIRAFKPVERLPEDVEQLAGIYRTLLAGKQILVFLDDARDAAQVRALLPPRPALAIVTSRKRFDLAGYHTRDVSALPLDDAVKLICAVWGQTGEVTALAHRCGCLPMALRAAGALLKKPGMTPEFVNQKLAAAYERLQLADPENKNLTVAAAFQTSYDQLSPDLQCYWRSLGIFPADFNVKAAEAIWNIEDTPIVIKQSISALDRLLSSPTMVKSVDAWDILSDLYATGLVDYTGGRWHLHDLARDFTRSLWESAELYKLAYQHALYYRDLLAKANLQYFKGNEDLLAGLALFDLERSNIEAGQAWAAAHITDPSATKLCNEYPGAGGYVLSLRLHPKDHIVWLNAALTAAQTLGDREAECTHLGNLGNAWRELGKPIQAIDYYEKGLEIARNIGDRRNIGTALGDLGIAYKDLGQLPRAIDYYEQWLAISREVGDRRNEGNALGNLGNAWYLLGEYHRAIEFYEQRLVIAYEIGDRRGEGVVLGHLGNIWASLNEPRRAIEYYEQALVISREIGDRRHEGNVLGNLGNAWSLLDVPLQAIDCYEQHLTIAREIGDRRGEGQALGNLGIAYKDLGEPCRAIEYYEQSLVIAREIGDRRGEGAVLNNLAVAYQNLGEARRAIEYYEQCLTLHREIGDRQGEANACWNLGLLLEGQGELPRAVELMQVAVHFYSSIGHPRAEGLAAKVAEIRQKLK